MPDAIDRKLEELLSYPEPPRPGHDSFVADVMQELRAEQRRRRVVLGVFGGIGALFGLAGAMMLSDPVSRLFTEALSGFSLAQAALFTVGGMAFYLWFMNDDLALDN